ncbi:hypothetical protein JVU11DRAFT_2277 [Chiua virens]|nr:hypothetical protein JVU11DRAFT_2277 [Chiua virens]
MLSSQRLADVTMWHGYKISLSLRRLPIQLYASRFNVKRVVESEKMSAYNHGNGADNYATPQGHAANATHGAASEYAPNMPYAPAPGDAVPSTPTTPPGPPVPTPTSTPPLTPVQVPSGCYPIELVQFWRDECTPSQPSPLHWALFVRTAPLRAPCTGSSPRSRSASLSGPVGNFYELVGTPDTYTAQFLPDVMFEPSALADWRGTHVVGWVSPGQLGVFERVVRQVPVWRHRADWWCQQWVYDVVRAVGASACPGVFIMTDGMTFGGMQRHLGRLLEAWENGDI